MAMLIRKGVQPGGIEIGCHDAIARSALIKQLLPVEKMVARSVRRLLLKDRFLIVNKIHEPSISHRLALYIESRFGGFNVDCEYNGGVDGETGRKKISDVLVRHAEIFGVLTPEEARKNSRDDFISKDVCPDIIVHRRGGRGLMDNLLVIEVKKSTNENRVDWDKYKLSRFTSGNISESLHYQFGAFMMFVCHKDPWCHIIWYHNGVDFHDTRVSLADGPL
ncbi:MAG TPA: hypothetical protein VFS21_26120 [Roseiflexaceae bacterium]|nr:hypothetical protein [Roseiflexaceae bacterium]